jgi:pyruvate kinase
MVMLSAEVANGAFPVETCATMRRIVEETEFHMDA